ncbi:type III secretion system export apparatus subunit SctV [Endozoicomonas sp. SM1973]|uniref:Type III secretion system export apparatus subunit SctV n=1 Tax=Spartinivicinus marinus TaxID=2994442 RepID=A0A853IAA5_9GAMM|nr:type III secretion system export apparatus subunit SctV [Spartinivicinus marinus]MCX4028140.1 type III secretion system export apparatus subunit SctV [Spartinivicinus marinus]NYZ66185.1 type III secretion system export apparatus subunit SctV [Spartinivicinus marinus]
MEVNKILQKINFISNAVITHAELLIPLAVVGIVFMMILPLPTMLVDGLIALNICVSSLLVVLAMYLPGPLAFSTFPSVILITTLFRLALSITTTRLILLQADAGSIVEAFGHFVVGGNFAVGVVIFLILTIVQFLVITKGSERVAEVGARFSLDAMPGKQMSIDSDLRAGLISPYHAAAAREALGKESQLYGAMDGAMKFVKGDAIAGLIIVFVNLIGGASIGALQKGMTGAEALQLYAILTIGDGLVAQIPALLLALTAGMIITRVSSNNVESKLNVGKEIVEQVLSQPKAWLIAATVMLGFASVPGMPTAVFICLSLISAVLGFTQLKANEQAQQQAAIPNSSPPTDEEIKLGKVDATQYIPTQPFLLKLHTSLDGSKESERLIEKLRSIRNHIVTHYGMSIPKLAVSYTDSISTSCYQFCVYEVPAIMGTVCSAKLAVINNEATLQQLAIPFDKGLEERNEGKLNWVDYQYKEQLASANIQCFSCYELVEQAIEKIYFQKGPQFTGVQEVAKIAAWLEKERPELAKELVRVIPYVRIAEILQRLMAERIGLRNMRKILETLVEHAGNERDIAVLVEHIRVALRDQICYEFADNNQLSVMLLSLETEDVLRKAIRNTSNGGFLALEGEMTRHLLDQIGEVVNACTDKKCPVLLVAQDIRRHLRNLIEVEYFHIHVMSYAEISDNIKILSLIKISI